MSENGTELVEEFEKQLGQVDVLKVRNARQTAEATAYATSY